MSDTYRINKSYFFISEKYSKKLFMVACEEREAKKRLAEGSLTELMLHHPDLELNEAVGVEAVVLSDTAVADFMATEIQLALIS